MIFAADNDPRVHFYGIDYTDNSGDVSVRDSLCYPSVRKYNGFDDFYNDHSDYIDSYDDVDFYEMDYSEAMKYDIDDMVCYDEDNDMWDHVVI